MNVIKKTDWVSNFQLVGKPKINDYTFKIDEKSEKSNWIYNSLNLGINAGEKHGIVYAEMMGGYSADNNNVIYCHGKNDDGSDDFASQIIVDWDDRFDEAILETIGDLCYITVGLEKTDKGNTFYKKFLSAYDAIAYVKEVLTEDMTVIVRGRLQYSEYNGNTQVRKTIQSIALSNAEPDKYRATFTQSILLDSDSVSLKPDGVDKDKGVIFVNARVLDYLKEKNGVEIKGQYPYYKTFEFPVDLTNAALCKKLYDSVFKVKKNTITQITFEGEFIESGATVKITLDDISDELKELIELGLYKEEEVLARCSGSGNREKRMLLRRPHYKIIGDDDNKTQVMQKFEERYTEDDLLIEVGESEENPFFETDTNDNDNDNDNDNGLDWLNSL